jgi:two-component system LytT family sensor kinase
MNPKSPTNIIALKPGRVRILLHILFWVVFVYLSSGFWLGILSFRSILERSLLVTLTNAAMGYGNIYFLFPRFFPQKKYGTYALVLLLWILPFIAIRLWLEPDLVAPFGTVSRIPAQAYRIVIAASSLIMLALSVAYAMAEQYFNLIREKSILETSRLQAETNFLRSQVNPHSLFNILNNLYALTLLKNDKAPEIVLKLSSLMRFMLHDSNLEWIPIQKEIQYIRDLADLELLRFEKPGKVELHLEIENGNQMISPFLFIPLVENCFKHTPLDSDPEAFIKITMKQSVHGNGVQFQSLNTLGTGRKSEHGPGGIGIRNLRKRLEILYPGKYRLETGNDNSIYSALLEIEFS